MNKKGKHSDLNINHVQYFSYSNFTVFPSNKTWINTKYSWSYT